jgi:hypothetical protein
MPKTLLERLEAMLGGPIVGYDGRFLVWHRTEHPYMQRDSKDLRDVLPKLKGATLTSLREALPTFDLPKRGKVAVIESEE